jgi:Zn-dependent protease
MSWAWTIGHVRGIRIRVHATFPLLMLWVALAEYGATGTAAGALAGVAFILAVFAVVVLHELGHALTAARFGIATRDITLLPIGGVARLERMPKDPRQELWVALAGPAVNVAIASALAVVLLQTGGAARLVDPAAVEASVLLRFMWVNVALALFNLVPAFPMDGGRVLRALLALRLPYHRATRVAAGLGQAIALLVGLLGLYGNPMLVLIAVFVWVGAASEAQASELEHRLRGLSTAAGMITRFHALAFEDPLQRAVELLIAGFQHDFPVLADGEVVGMLGREGLARGLAEAGPGGAVGLFMAADFPRAQASEPLPLAFERLRASPVGAAPVLDRGRLVGLLTAENVAELLLVREALEHGQTLRTATPGAPFGGSRSPPTA